MLTKGHKQYIEQYYLTKPYRQIAMELGISKSSVQSYVSRHLKGKAVKDETFGTLCAVCKKLFTECLNTPIPKRTWVKKYKSARKRGYTVYKVLQCDNYENGRQPLDAKNPTVAVLEEMGIIGVI